MTCEIDEHHTVEDVALVLGDAISGGARRPGRHHPLRGCRRCPWMRPSPAAPSTCRGRPYAVLDIAFRGERVGALSTQLVEHVLESLARTDGHGAPCVGQGRNDHHIAEAVFKSLARALRAAVAVDPRRAACRPPRVALG